MSWSRHRGRGATINPPNRFGGVEIVEHEPSAPRASPTVVPDRSRTIITSNSSPDVPFELSINPYRGCEHGCAYCYARALHEYLGWSAGLDFETRIAVKFDAPDLLRRELSRHGYRPRPISLSGATDAYQPLERRLHVTRRIVEVLVETRHPMTVVTKNALVVRDIDLLTRLTTHGAVTVWLSVTTLDSDLARRLEPRTSQPRARLEAIRRLTEAGVPCGVLAVPMIPGLTDHELPTILAAAANAGARWARAVPVRLPGQVATVFCDWLGRHEPDRKRKIVGRIRSTHDGRLDDAVFGRRMRGDGVHAQQMRRLFEVTARRLGLATEPPPLRTDAFVPPGGLQRRLLDDVEPRSSATISEPPRPRDDRKP